MSQKQSFEEALYQLEQIVKNLENSELPLEESLKIFQKGIELSNYCGKKLNEAEKKITSLLEKSDGTIEENDFLND